MAYLLLCLQSLRLYKGRDFFPDFIGIFPFLLFTPQLELILSHIYIFSVYKLGHGNISFTAFMANEFLEAEADSNHRCLADVINMDLEQ